MSETTRIDEFHIHEMILRDRPRVTAYYDAIMNNKHLFENKVVLDIGCGTAIFSMFAAKAGAKRVYAVDSCPNICRLANELIETNHLQDRIRVINQRIEDIEKFDEKIDIILSEWMGFFLFHQGMLESVIDARDRFLEIHSDEDDFSGDQTESIVIFPSHAYLYCAPFVDDHVRVEQNRMWKDYFDLDLTPIVGQIKNSNLTNFVIDAVESCQLIEEAQLIQSIDLRTVKKDDLHTMRSFCEFQIENTCVISGFCFWFDCYFSSTNNSSILRSTRLTSSPYASKTHWKQTLVFLDNDIYPLKGDVVPVHIKLKQSIEHRNEYHLSITMKKIKSSTTNGTKVDDETLPNDFALRKRQRRRSSTISYDKRLIHENKSSETSSETSSSNSDDEIQTNEHSIPCSCDRDRCKLIKTIIERYTEESHVE